MKWISYCICTAILSLALSGCGIDEREKALAEREARLAQREEQLLQRENSLNQKEQAVLKKEQQADSTRQDTTALYNPNILGRWNTVMTCTETTCPNSAVGDTKSEIWEFSYENNYLVAKAMTGSQIIRIYSGTFTSNRGVQLTANVEPTPETPATKMLVRLNPVAQNSMEGQREILRAGGCKIIYSLKLNR